MNGFQNVFHVSQLYEQIVAENEKLKAQLHDTNMELTDLKLQLEKATQVCIYVCTYQKTVLYQGSKNLYGICSVWQYGITNFHLMLYFYYS